MQDPEPRMSEVERAMFERVLARGAGGYLEWGAGGSTLAAVRAPIGRILSVESDAAWLERLRAHPEVATAAASGRARLLHGDIGPVGAWGAPADDSAFLRWPRYVATAWAWCAEAGFWPELVLVDGRFRTACALSVLLAARAGGGPMPALLFHDFIPEQRSNYRPLLGFFDIAEQAETLALLAPRPGVGAASLMAGFAIASTDRI